MQSLYSPPLANGPGISAVHVQVQEFGYVKEGDWTVASGADPKHSREVAGQAVQVGKQDGDDRAIGGQVDEQR